ncbi:hypothetical protein E2562_032749, partial [Oryza meyeriana var. granulata]
AHLAAWIHHLEVCGEAWSTTPWFISRTVKYVNQITKLCVIRVSREDHQKAWAAITMVRSIGKIPVSLNLQDVSGSIRACKKFEYYKLAAGDRITPKFVETMESCFDKIKGLES